jgi:DNA-binding transcriptional LysR family regulator
MGRHSPAEGVKIISNFQRGLGFKLFVDECRPSAETLTTDGKNFLPAVDDLIDVYVKGFLDVYANEQVCSVLKIRSTFSFGKNLLLPCMTAMNSSALFEHIGVDLQTSSNKKHSVEDICSHILFKNLNSVDNLFFERKWALHLEQGLFASEGYLLDVGTCPKKESDLSAHSILGYGDSCDRNKYKIMNWHLSGKYGLGPIEPSILISSPSVVIAAVEASLGIGPVVAAHERLGHKKLFRILPHISGPPLTIDFAVRKRLPKDFEEFASRLSGYLLETIDRIGLEISR